MKGRIRPFCVNTAKPISTAYVQGVRQIEAVEKMLLLWILMIRALPWYALCTTVKFMKPGGDYESNKCYLR